MRLAGNLFFLLPAALVGALLLLATAVPRFAAEPGLHWPLYAAAAVFALWHGVLALGHRTGRRPLSVGFLARPQHYVQIACHLCIYGYWGTAWPEVAAHAPHIASQIAFLYLLDMGFALTRHRAFTFTFGPFPIVFSTNLFLWFTDANYGWQYAMLLVGYLGKTFLKWPRPSGANADVAGGHVFNPSAFGLALFSLVLIATQRTDMTWGHHIASMMERPPQPHLWIFLVGLVVQLAFAPVLITMSAALATVLGGFAVHALTDRWLFVDTAIPVNVYLGMTLLVTDPSTSPRTAWGKVLFGASYGLSVLGLYPALEALGAAQNPAAPIPLAYFDKLLQVPLLNLLVPLFDRAGRRLTRASTSSWPERRRNALHVALWACVFAAIHPWLSDHPGRDPALWVRLCETRGGAFCREVATGHDLACFEQDALPRCAQLAEMYRRGDRIERNDELAGKLYARACERGFAPGCTGLAEMLLAGGRGVPQNPGQALALFERGCRGDDAAGCLGLASLLGDGVYLPPDPQAARGARARACALGLADACRP